MIQARFVRAKRRGAFANLYLIMACDAGDQCIEGLTIIGLAIRWQQKRCPGVACHGWLNLVNSRGAVDWGQRVV